MASLLKAKPVSVQIRCRAFFVPPKYDLYKVEVSTMLATRLAEIYRLKSTDIIVNQNIASTQYISFRYIVGGEPFRYMDVSIGVDQGEVYFSNPATLHELMTEVIKIWSVVFEILRPTATSSYFEATLHCETEKPGAIQFLNDIVGIKSNKLELQKGFSIGSRSADGAKKLSLEVSDSVADGLYVVFASISNSVIPDISTFSGVLESQVDTYRNLQGTASVKILEPNADGTFSA